MRSARSFPALCPSASICAHLPSPCFSHSVRRYASSSADHRLYVRPSDPGVARAALASRPARTTPGSLGRTYKRWSAEEEAYFLGLCEKHGEGKWAQMLAEGQRAGKLRADLTSVHLKDKYRNLKTKRATRRPSRA